VASAHALTAFCVHTYLNIDPTLSNFAGFVVGAVLSYLGSYYFTFRLSEGHKRSLPRFALVWLIGIAINVGLFKVLLTQFNIPFMINVLVAIVLTPIAQFLMLKFWAFKN
jgi:putative flippase GtrA